MRGDHEVCVRFDIARVNGDGRQRIDKSSLSRRTTLTRQVPGRTRNVKPPLVFVWVCRARPVCTFTRITYGLRRRGARPVLERSLRRSRAQNGPAAGERTRVT